MSNQQILGVTCLVLAVWVYRLIEENKKLRNNKK